MKYKGVARDRLGELKTRETRQHETYLEAHQAAERLCSKYFTGDRGEVDAAMKSGQEGGQHEIND